MTPPPAETHRWTHRVRIRDLDAYGHTNHTAFLQWLEEGRERFLRDRGLSFLSFLEAGTPLVMAGLKADYRGQVAYGADVEVETRVDRVGRTSVAFGHRVAAAGAVVLEAQATMVFVDRAGRPVAVPEGARPHLG